MKKEILNQVFLELFENKQPKEYDEMIWLSQSIIKTVTNPETCPRRYKAYSIDKLFESSSTEAMHKGTYFEYLALGSPDREGRTPEAPLIRGGKKPVDYIRIEEQAKLFPQIMEDNNIIIIDANTPIMHPYNDKIMLTGILDAKVEIDGKKYIMDLKLTKDLTSTFGEFAWGNFEYMDKLQAYMYMHIMKMITGEDWGFVYAVFDYKPKYEHKLFFVDKNEMNMVTTRGRITDAAAIIQRYESYGYIEKPNWNSCKVCQIESCEKRITERPDPTPNIY